MTDANGEIRRSRNLTQNVVEAKTEALHKTIRRDGGIFILMTLQDISVVMPTRNCRHLLEPTLDTVREWVGDVNEVIVVDSFSTDGTVELLKESLNFPNVRFTTHPPGLYASWNYGISQAGSDWLYMATAGDVMGREDLEYLLGVAKSTGADIIVSPPEFYDEQHQKVDNHRWPIHELLEHCPDKEVVELSGVELVAFALTYCMPPLRYDSWLCSSASNLYRTSVLQANPFPENAGHGGDTLLGVQVATLLKAAFCRRSCGRFVLHTRPKAVAAEEQVRIHELFNAVHQKCFGWLVGQLIEAPGSQCAKFLEVLVKAPEAGVLKQHKLATDLEELYVEYVKITQMARRLQEEKTHHRETCTGLKKVGKEWKEKARTHERALKQVKDKIPKWLRRLLRVDI